MLIKGYGFASQKALCLLGIEPRTCDSQQLHQRRSYYYYLLANSVGHLLRVSRNDISAVYSRSR